MSLFLSAHFCSIGLYVCLYARVIVFDYYNFVTKIQIITMGKTWLRWGPEQESHPGINFKTEKELTSGF